MTLPVLARSSGARKFLEDFGDRQNFPSAIASLLCDLQTIFDDLVVGMQVAVVAKYGFINIFLHNTAQAKLQNLFEQYTRR